ncbi:AbrB family transcriptional regulator [Candidatus Bathyarchaeota archaeon]|nr:MAG: AbrB family transcriptional regulator [Candidatus Bathyarchaeota archaeon]
MGEKTKVTASSSKLRSLKTTLPIRIADELDIKAGSWLDWEIRELNNERVMVARKID